MTCRKRVYIGGGGGGATGLEFFFSLVREFQMCFVISSYSAIKKGGGRGVHKDLLTDCQRDSLKLLFSTLANTMIFPS